MNLSALTSRDFRIYISGNIFASNAVWMQRVTVGWIAWDLTASAAFVGMVAFVNFMPSLLVGPLFGVLIDRVRVKQAAIVTQSLSFLIAIGFYVFFVVGILNEHNLLFLTLCSGIIISAHSPIRMSLGPRLVDTTSVASVVTLGAINFNIARLTGPAIAGWIIAFYGIKSSLFVQILCYPPFLLALSFLRPRSELALNVQKEAFMKAFTSGILYAFKSPLILKALLITSLSSFLLRSVLEILPVIADGLYERGATGLGLLTSCAGFGALLAGMAKAFSSSQPPGVLPQYVPISIFFGFAFIPLIGLCDSWSLTLGFISYLGFAGTLSGISLQSAIQMELEDNLRGRVMSLWTMAAIGGTALGAIFLGGFTDYLGVVPALVLTGSIGCLLLVTLLNLGDN
ncbi:MAG: MFS transporter [Planktomarina sp.]|uniref:MFS transporter n=2 Tax=Planktomarina TaxID=1284657 RepID=UPI002892855A|nr:MFS transporter [Planktomarina sp.]MDG1293918.1 MFS transporter [Planktomarina sp.]MDT2030684.1 MFS transporter [Planktomarina sp.]MDT2071226.1 MFS transporter [Planktomarina sp.]